MPKSCRSATTGCCASTSGSRWRRRRDPDDERNAFLEIRAGTGGDESALFAGDLAACTPATPSARAGRSEIISRAPSELGGYKEMVLRIEGEGAYGS
jgi:peptide chain release factor 1